VVIDLYLNIFIGDIDGDTRIYKNGFTVYVYDIYCPIMDLCFVHLKSITVDMRMLIMVLNWKNFHFLDWHLGTQKHLKPRRYQVPETG